MSPSAAPIPGEAIRGGPQSVRLTFRQTSACGLYVEILIESRNRSCKMFAADARSTVV